MDLSRRKRGAAFAAPFLATLLLLWGTSALAAAMGIDPVRLELGRVGEAAELRIRNNDDYPVSVDLVAKLWTQTPDGQELLGDTDEILALPPIFTIAPGSEQIVRVAFLGQMDPDRERTFRLLITELDSPAIEKRPSTVSMRLQISLPVFVMVPGQGSGPNIQLVSARKSDDGTFVSLRNAGNAHVKLQGIEIHGSEGRFPGEGQPAVGQATYMLPGSTVDFFIPGDAGELQRVIITPDRGKGWEHAVAAPE
jgi:fimbrial chaperone protein